MKIIHAYINEYFEQVGVDTSLPRFSWAFANDDQGQSQQHYRILLAKEPEALELQSDLLFDSGEVASSVSIGIPYAGSPLEAVQTYYWKVQVWDEKDQLVESEVNSFVTGKMDEPWQAQWIGSSTNPSKPFYLRQDFQLEKKVTKAYGLVSGLGQFLFYINGKKVGDHELDPGWTNYQRVVQYVTFDVTDHLNPGQNTIGLEVANGWYVPDAGDQYYAKAPGIAGLNKISNKFSFGSDEDIKRFSTVLAGLVELHLHFENGTRQVVCSDDSWKVASSPTTLANVFGSEVYDARKYPEGWSQPDFDDSEWQAARILSEEDRPKGKLVSQSQPPVMVKKTYEAEFIREINGGMLYDLGQNMSGILELEVVGKSGQIVKLRPAEKLDQKGMINQKIDNFFIVEFHDLDIESTYILRGDERGETWRQSFSYFGGRYVHVKGVSAVPDYPNLPYLKSLKAHYITTASPVTGHFETSDERVNAVYKLVSEAVDSNLNHVHTDCPTIEKFAWLETSHLMAPSIMYHRHVTDLWSKILGDIRSEQYCETDYDMGGGKKKQFRGKGFIPPRAPNYVFMGFETPFGNLWDNPNWGSTILIATEWHYHFFGDKNIIVENYVACKAFVGHLRTKLTEDGLLNYGVGDWGNPDLTALAKSNIETAIYYRNLQLLAKFASILNKTDESKRFETEAQEVRDNYNDRFLIQDKKTKRWGYRAAREPKAILRILGNLKKIGKPAIAKMTQACQAVPLHYGMVPEDKRRDVEQTLLDTLDDKGFVCGEVALYYVLQALNEMGENQRIADFIVNEEHPSYYRFVQQGETTLPEVWTDKARSRNHDMLGHILGWFWRGMAGIESLEDAFRKIRIQPFLPKGMDHFRCAYDSVRGRITVEVSKERETDSVQLHVEIPPNCEAIVDISRLGGENLTVATTQESVQTSQVLLQSGNYTLVFDHKTDSRHNNSMDLN